MINDVTRRLSREQTLVIAERSRDDPHLPTDLWKKPVIISQTFNLHRDSRFCPKIVVKRTIEAPAELTLFGPK